MSAEEPRPANPVPSGDADEALRHNKQSFSRAILRLIELDEGPAVVKDFSGKGWLFREIVGPWLLTREERAYERLCGMPGFPPFAKRLGRYELAVARVDGEVLGKDVAPRLDRAFFDEFAATVDRMHARGVFHLDLHQKRNILVTPEGRPILIDFASSFRLGDNWLVARTIRPVFAGLDRVSVIKFKSRYAPDLLEEDEARRLKRARWLSFLWIFRGVNEIKKRIVRARRARRRADRDGTPPDSA